MSEALSSGGESISEVLARQILDFQKAVMPELKRKGADRINTSTYAGLGTLAIKDIVGSGEVKVVGNTWTEDELGDNATIWITIDAKRKYRIDIRAGVLSDAYDQDEKRVEDEAILVELQARLRKKRLACKVLSLKNYFLR